MKTYLLQSSRFDGHVLFEFNDEGLLVRYDLTEATLNEEQTVFILQKLPKTIDAIQTVLGNSKEAKLILQKVVAVTFDMFWFDKGRARWPQNSSKKKCLTWWNRSKQTERDKAYNYLPAYEKNIPAGTARKYAETYLNAELWNN